MDRPDIFSLIDNNDEIGIKSYIKKNIYSKKFLEDLNGRNKFGITPIVFAITENMNDIAIELIYALRDTYRYLDVDIFSENFKNILNEKNNLIQSALQLAVYKKKPDLTLVKALLDSGANVNIKDSNADSVLFLAIKGLNYDLVKLLLDYNADINYINSQKNALSLAIVARMEMYKFKEEERDYYRNEGTKIIELLLRSGVKVDFEDQDYSPLMLAVQDGPYLTELLLKYGADVNYKTDRKASPLHVTQNFEIIKLLLDAGADPTDVQPQYFMCKKCKDLIVTAQWKYYKKQNTILARQLAKSKDNPLNKDVWYLILLNNLQMKLCENIEEHTKLNKDLLILFAIDIGADPTEIKNLNAAKLCGLISRQIGRSRSQASQEMLNSKSNLENIQKAIKSLAFKHNLDTSLPINNLIDQLKLITE